MKNYGYRMYCLKCRKIVNVQAGNKEKRVLPELKTEFNLITLCCSICGEPVIKVTELNSKTGSE